MKKKSSGKILNKYWWENIDTLCRWNTKASIVGGKRSPLKLLFGKHFIFVIYLCIHGKYNPWDYVTMKRDVRLFKVSRVCFLHHKSIGFTLTRNKLSVQPPTHSLRYWSPLRITNNNVSINCFFFWHLARIHHRIT